MVDFNRIDPNADIRALREVRPERREVAPPVDCPAQPERVPLKPVAARACAANPDSVP